MDPLAQPVSRVAAGLPGRDTAPPGRIRGRQRGEFMTASGEIRWPRTGRISRPLKKDAPRMQSSKLV